MFKVIDIGFAKDDEADKIRRVLEDNMIDYYETPTGWRTAGAVWVKNKDDYEKAINVISLFVAQTESDASRWYKRRLSDDFKGSEISWLVFNLRKYGVIKALWIWGILLLIISILIFL